MVQSIQQYLKSVQPDDPKMFFSRDVLLRSLRQFQTGFDGVVSYAVKANPDARVLKTLVAGGLNTFDVASIQEMRSVRAICPNAVLHYNNPIRSKSEIAQAIEMGVRSYSVDCCHELDKLSAVPRNAEISVRLALPVVGGVYGFESKFGAPPEQMADLLKQVAARRQPVAITFHPGTQCSDPQAWVRYISEAAKISQQTGVRLARMNVGGGFPAHRNGDAPQLRRIFDAIAKATKASFGPEAPILVCEPGRAMVAESFAMATRIKSLRGDGRIYMNDGIYGGLAEARDIDANDRITVLSSMGWRRKGPLQEVILFGPSCDSLDRLPELVAIPRDAEEGDYILFHGMGAYSLCLATQFNGYGVSSVLDVSDLSVFDLDLADLPVSVGPNADQKGAPWKNSVKASPQNGSKISAY